MFKKILLIFALFLTVAGASALTTVWLSARPVGAYSDLEYRVDVLESDVRKLGREIDSLSNDVRDAEMSAGYGRCMCLQ